MTKEPHRSNGAGRANVTRLMRFAVLTGILRFFFWRTMAAGAPLPRLK